MLSLVVLLLAISPSCAMAAAPIHHTGFVTSATNISLEIDFGNGTVLNHQGLTGSNVLETTESVLSVVVSWYGNMAFVESISGVGNSQVEGRWWQYWVNGELGPVAANVYQVSDGDSIVWRYTGSQSEDLEGKGPDSTQLYEALILVGLGLGFLAILFVVRRRS
ncbi:MAG: DUF4430 domain-containing protein [Candidatus Hermodarchaeota archaeon]